MNIKEYAALIKELEKASDSYYNSGNPIMTDAEYDYKILKLKEFEAKTGILFSNSPTLNVGAPVLSSLEKVQITPKPMLSLDKCHSDVEVAEFANNHPMIAMIKLDGLSVRVKYNNGKLISANTRGNGVEGTDITEHIKQFQNIPLAIPYTGEYIVDGEAIIKISDFEEINKNGEFKNPRNAAAGALNVLDTKLVKDRKLSFIVWDVIDGYSLGSNYLSSKLEEAKMLGFEIVPYEFYPNYIKDEPETIGDINQELMALRDKYPCDGIVWKYDNFIYGDSLGATGHHFKNAIAWKPEIEIVESKLKYIDWTLGRTGVLTPVAVFYPVELDGSTVERASLHNYSIMRKILGPCAYKGEPVKIFKANMIIPQILEAGPHMGHDEIIASGGAPANDIIEQCPVCGGDVILETSPDGVLNFICANPLCEGKLVNRLDHYCGKKGLDIKGLSEATLEKLVNLGWLKNLKDIYSLENHRDEWVKQPGFGAKSVDKILAAINESKNTSAEAFISAIGIPLIGKSAAKELMKNFNSYEEFRSAVDNKDYHFSNLNNFGIEMDNSLKDFNYEEADEIHKILVFNEKTEDKPKDSSLEGNTFVITGSLKTYKNRAALQNDIETRGGKVGNSITSKTSYLINNDIDSVSSKNQKAKSLGIPIISEQEFIEKFLH